MRFIKRQLWWWPIVLIVGGAAFAMPIATRVSPTATVVVQERQHDLDHQTTVHHSKDSTAAVGPGVAAPQDDYYDRRREYWERRVERRLDEEDLDSDDNDDEDAKDTKAGKDDEDDDEDQVEQEIERRREFWRRRVDRGW